MDTLTWSLHCGEALAVLQTLPSASVQCCVTSPPYWGLRDYGHAGQLGLESTPDTYLAALVAVFAEVRRVLAADGTCWLNLGDSYSGAGYSNHDHTGGAQRDDGGKQAHLLTSRTGLKPKDLIGLPWRAAFALQADGWYLRSDIIWAKPNPMPQSVTDRPTTAHEYIFLLTREARYAYDAAAIATPVDRASEGTVDVLGPRGPVRVPTSGRVGGNVWKDRQQHSEGGIPDPARPVNARTVWTINPEASPYDHFAVMPKALARKCILAGAAPGTTVLDPFAGVATTGVVALEEGRSFVGIELSPKYHALGRTRLLNTMPMFSSEAEATA